MSALADFAHKFGSESRELKIGQSFFKDADSVFHTIRYDFVPASVDPNKTSAVDIGQNGKVTVTVPNLEGSGTTESVYQGQRKPHQKECVLIIDNETGDMTLEKLNTSMIVKKARLRQEDLTGKSLALNKSGIGTLSQCKSSINDKKVASFSNGSCTLKSGQSMPNVGKLPKQSSPQPSTVLINSNSAQSRSNGFQPKTPSPPSMPIFSANKGTLLRGANGHTSGNNSGDPVSEWNDFAKSAMLSANESSVSSRHQSNSSAHAKRLSEESSSESSDNGNSDEESSSSPSSDSSSEEEGQIKPSPATNARSNALSMPSFSMPTSLVVPANIVKSPSLLSADLKKPTVLTLSEDSDSSDDESKRKLARKSSSKANAANKLDQVQKGPPTFASESSKSFPDSMPKFTNGSSASNFSSMPKYSQLSQDLQLSESGSDSDD